MCVLRTGARRGGTTRARERGVYAVRRGCGVLELTAKQAKYAKMDLAALEKVLGDDVFFVPCEWGTKKPLVTYVERPFEATKTEAYRALFEVQDVNVAVYLGKASGGLCAIDFDRDEDLTAFLAANPGLENTTQSRGSRGGMVWLRMNGEYPE